MVATGITYQRVESTELLEEHETACGNRCPSICRNGEEHFHRFAQRDLFVQTLRSIDTVLDRYNLLLNLLLRGIRVDAADDALALLSASMVHQLSWRFRAPEK